MEDGNRVVGRSVGRKSRSRYQCVDVMDMSPTEIAYPGDINILLAA